MNHLRWDLDCRFAGDKNNAPPITLFHAREIVAAEAHATQKVHFEKTQPVGIGYVFEWLGLEDAQVIDWNVDFRKALNGCTRSVRGSEISGQTFDLARNASFIEGGNGLVDALRGASVYDDACPLSRQAPRYSETDAGRGACDKCAFSLELQIHSALDETPTKKIQVA